MPERLNMTRPADILGDVFETLRLRGSIFFCSELAAPWGIALEAAGMPRFHIALAGDCHVGADGGDAVTVRSRDIVLFPHGPAHWIADQPGRELIASERAGMACELGNPFFQQGEITHRLMCGLVHYDPHAAHPMLDTLPPMLHFTELEETDSIWLTVTLIDAQIRHIQNHCNAIVDRLTEALFLQLLQHYAHNNSDAIGFIAALKDRRVHQALSLIHRQPSAEWSLSSLSTKTGMSRATLVRRFRDAMEITPMSYVRNWRMLKAHNLIKYTQQPLERIAQWVGFESARTLSKAFQRHYGLRPNELRQAERDC